MVVSLEAAPGRRPQPAVARALVAGCTASSVALTLQRPLRPTLADAPVRARAAAPRCRPHPLLLLRLCCRRLSSHAAAGWAFLAPVRGSTWQQLSTDCFGVLALAGLGAFQGSLCLSAALGLAPLSCGRSAGSLLCVCTCDWTCVDEIYQQGGESSSAPDGGRGAAGGWRARGCGGGWTGTTSPPCSPASARHCWPWRGARHVRATCRPSSSP